MNPAVVNFIAWVRIVECVLGLILAGGFVLHGIDVWRARRRAAKALIFDPIRAPRWWRTKS